MESRSGLSVTAPTGNQFRVSPDQRAGLSSRAVRYRACLNAMRVRLELIRNIPFRPATRQRSCPPGRQRLHLCAETAIPQSPTLIRGIADGIYIRLGNLSAEQLPISGLTFHIRATKTLIQLMPGNQHIRISLRIGTTTRPRVITRMRHHIRSHRIQLNVTLATQQIVCTRQERKRPSHNVPLRL